MHTEGFIEIHQTEAPVTIKGPVYAAAVRSVFLIWPKNIGVEGVGCPKTSALFNIGRIAWEDFVGNSKAASSCTAI